MLSSVAVSTYFNRTGCINTAQTFRYIKGDTRLRPVTWKQQRAQNMVTNAATTQNYSAEKNYVTLT